MIIDNLRNLTLHGHGNPPAFHLASTEEFSTYVAWPGVQDKFRGRGGAVEGAKDEVEEENQMFRDIYR